MPPSVAPPESIFSDSHQLRPRERAYYPALDGLRAISFFAVFLHHYYGFLYGWAGVDVFFVLSGFLITGILYDTQDDAHKVRNFYVRRTLRIFPLYYGVLLFLFAVTPWMHWEWTWQWLAWPLYLGNYLRFLYPHQDNAFVGVFANAQIMSHTRHHITLFLGHFWTLCVEEQFYMVWPWIVFAVRDRRKLIAICVACIVLVPVARAIAVAHLPAALISGEVVLHSTPFRFDTLMVGALLALLQRSAYREQMQRVAQFVLPVGLMAVVYVAIHWVRFRSYSYPTGLSTWLLSVIAIFAGALMLRTLVPGTVAYRIFHVRWLRAVGTVSYGAYVFHDILHQPYRVLAAMLVHKHAYAMTGVIGITTTLVMAFMSYRYFEAPILRLKDRLTLVR